MIKKFASSILIIVFVLVTSGVLYPLAASAAALTTLSDTVTNLTASTLASETVTFTTATAMTASQTIVLTFNNGTTIGAVVAADLAMTVGGVTQTISTSGAGTWGFSVASPAITFTAPSSGATIPGSGVVIVIKIGVAAGGTNRITNGSAGTTTLAITSGTGTDSGSVVIPIISNGVVNVSATVQPTISFTVSANTINFGIIPLSTECFATTGQSTSANCTNTSEVEAFNMTAATNAAGGYAITVQGPTLTYNTTNTFTTPTTATAYVSGTEQFGIRANATGGSGTVTAPYATASDFAYAGTSTPSQVASASTQSATTTYSMRYEASISSTTKAGNYSASHTYVATGTF